MNKKSQAQDHIIFQSQNDISFLQRQINGNFSRQGECFKLWHVQPIYGFCGEPAESLNETRGGLYELADLTKSPEPDFGNLQVGTVFHLLRFSEYKPPLLSLKEIVFIKNRSRNPEAFQQVG